MKYLITIALLLAASTTALAQSYSDEEIRIKFGYSRTDIDTANLQGETLRPDSLRDAIGGGGAYCHYFGRKGGRGNTGLCIEAMYMVFTKDAANDQASYGRAGVEFRYQANGGEKLVRPFIGVRAGIFQPHLKDNVVVNPNTGEILGIGRPLPRPYVGVPFGVDFRKKRKGVFIEVHPFLIHLKNDKFENAYRKANVEFSFGFVL